MAIELLWGSGSPFSWRALLALEAKGIQYQSRQIEFSKGEHRAADFLKLNPRGKVPVLRDGDLVLCESPAILAYLDKIQPEPPLFGTTAANTGKIQQLVSECDFYLASVVASFTLPIFFGKLEESKAAVIEAATTARQEFARLEERVVLPFLLGSTLTAADIVYYPMLQSVLRGAGKPAAAALDLGFLPLDKHFPRLAAWTKRIEALPYYDKTYPPHWRA